jgi:hypothetical protein
VDKRTEQIPNKRKYKMAKRQMRRFSTSNVFREFCIKATTKYHFRMANRKPDNSNVSNIE